MRTETNENARTTNPEKKVEKEHIVSCKKYIQG
jgi:hypothetical protein